MIENLDSYLWQTSMSVKNNHWYLLKFIDVSDFNRLGWNTENGTDFLECNLKLAITTKFRTWSCCILLNILLDWLQSWHYNYNLSAPTHHHFSKLVPKDFQNDSPIDYLSDFLNEKSCLLSLKGGGGINRQRDKEEQGVAEFWRRFWIKRGRR